MDRVDALVQGLTEAERKYLVDTIIARSVSGGLKRSLSSAIAQLGSSDRLAAAGQAMGALNAHERALVLKSIKNRQGSSDSGRAWLLLSLFLTAVVAGVIAILGMQP